MKKINDELLKIRYGAQKEQYTTDGVRALYNIILIVLVLSTNYAIFAWAIIAINVYFAYAAVRDMTSVIEEERREKTFERSVKKNDDRT